MGVEEKYEVYMISFRNKREKRAYNVITENGGNVQDWHLRLLEEFVVSMKERLANPVVEDFSDLC